MNASTENRKGTNAMRKGTNAMKRISILLSVFAACLLPAAISSAAAPPAGENFSFAEVTDPDTGTTAPAFPGERAFWAGVCDLRDGAAAVGARPVDPFSDCIDFTAPPNGDSDTVIMPPLAPGVAPELIPPSFTESSTGLDGWRTRGGTASTGPGWRLDDVTQAGARADGTASMWFSRAPIGIAGAIGYTFFTDGAPRDILASLPPGVIGNPNAVPKCPAEAVALVPASCHPKTQVGTATIFIGARIAVYPVYNVEARRGNAAEFMISRAGLLAANNTNVPIVARVRTESDFGADAGAIQIPAGLNLTAQSVTIWAVPWAKSHDRFRPVASYCGSPESAGAGASGATYGMPQRGLPGGTGGPNAGCSQAGVAYDPSWGPIKPFFTTQTECSATNPVTRAMATNFHSPTVARADSAAALITGCPDVSFPADISLQPTTRRADSPTGLDVDLDIPQNNEPPESVESNPDDVTGAPAFWKSKAGLAAAHLKDTTVTLPAGFSINSAAANGQAVCTTQQIGLTTPIGSEPIHFDNDDPFDGQGHDCPEASKIGTALVKTPLLDEADWPEGEVYLAAQKDNPFGSNYAIYLVLRSVERGLVVKLAGEVKADPVTGRLTTIVQDNPQLPFDEFTLRFKGGSQAPLATSPICGTGQNHTALAPYSDPANPLAIDEDVVVNQAADGGSCPTSLEARTFNLGFSAGSTTLLGGHSSPFTVRVQRPDGAQELDRISVVTPEGLVAKLAGVPYCSEASIAAAIARTAVGDGVKEKANPSCPASSQVGTTTIGAGAGISPVYVQGKAYLAGPYKGAPLSMAFIVPAVAGPFDLGVQVVRTALSVNPKNAQVTASSDEIPKILAGVPLRIRDVRVDIDRPGFILNPTDCSEQNVTGSVYGASGAVANVSNRFQVAECAQLGFKPHLKLRLFGGTKRGKYQRLEATVTARPGDANIARAAVTLPHSEFLAQEHIRTVCTRVQFAADQCPAGSIYGKATAISPLLDHPLSGPVYLRSSDNLLPDLVVALRGPDHQPIEVELSGRTDSKNGGIRNTFDIVPDAPVTKFTLEMMGGKKSLIVNSTDICKGIHRADVRMDAQNGRTHDFRPKVVNPKCEKGKKGKKSTGKKTKASKSTIALRALADFAGGLF